MIRRPPRSTLSSSSAASDVYKRQVSTQSTGTHSFAMAGSPFKLGHSIDYWAFMIIALCIIAFSILWEYGLEWLEHMAHQHRGLAGILQKVINELAILGTISFMFILVNSFVDLSSTLFLTFEVAHLMIFFFGIMYCLQAWYNFLIMKRLKRLVDVFDSLIPHVQDPAIYSPEAARESMVATEHFVEECVRYAHRNDDRPSRTKTGASYFCCPSLVRLEMEYHVLREWFLEEAGLPTTFDFAKYLRKCSSRVAQEKMEIHIMTWLGVVVWTVIWVVPSQLLAQYDVVASNSAAHYVFAMAGYSQVLIGLVGIAVHRYKLLNLLTTLGYTTDLELEKEIERIGTLEMKAYEMRPESKIIKRITKKRSQREGAKFDKFSVYKRHTIIEQLLLASTCFYLAAFCVWFGHNLKDVTEDPGLQAAWSIFVLLPALTTIIVIQPILFSLQTHFAALLFPDHFVGELGKVIERHGETKEQLLRILEIFRGELEMENCNCAEVTDLEAVFKGFDTEGKGWVTTEDFHAVLQQQHLYSFLGASGEKAVDRLMRLFDPNRLGHFDYHSFAQQLYRHTGVVHTASSPRVGDDGSNKCCGPVVVPAPEVGNRFSFDLGLDMDILSPRPTPRARAPSGASKAWFTGKTLGLTELPAVVEEAIEVSVEPAESTTGEHADIGGALGEEQF
eukprot:TRINITY_DN15050_c0_g1_i1.p1 TRINITY_DN15050_c0_g1~~TRINITY_DN15050_c0_g1_i1.p1  ORF type:complete len:675 (-),score=189.73 TRINITY_DN15050_c0_g1_i1:295-2319(-)